MALAIVTNALNALIKPAEQAGGTLQPREALLASFRRNLDALGCLLQQPDAAGQALRRLRGGVCANTSALKPLLGPAMDGAGGAREVDAVFRFGSECLLLLLALKAAMAEARASAEARRGSPPPPAARTRMGEAAPPPPLPADALAVGQTRTVQAALQFAVTLTVCPHLLPGVGVPLERRSLYGALLRSLATASEESRAAAVPPLSAACVALLELCEESTLGSLLLTRHLGDLLAGLCQLCYAPAAQEVSAATVEERRHCERKLSRLLRRVYQPAVVRELLVLKGAAVKGGRAPKWLHSTCSRLLTDAMLQPRGVLAVVGGVMEGACAASGMAGCADAAAADWRKCEAVARILASCGGRSSSPEAHYRIVCPQVLELLHIEDRQTARQFQRVATATAVTMAREHPALAHRYLLSPMLAPLARCTCADAVAAAAEAAPGTGAALVEEAELSRCVEDINKVVMACGSEPPPVVVLSALESVLQPLFFLCCFAKHGVSHLRSPCQETLLWFVEHAERERAVRAVGGLAGLPTRPPMLPTTPPTMPRSLHFAPGAHGGAVARIRMADDEDEAACGALEEEAWRLTCLTELLAAAQLSGFAGDFFLSCLKDLTALMVHEPRARDGGSTEGLEAPGAPEVGSAGDASDVEESDYQRLQLMQLIPYLCEKLGHGILQRTTQVVEFVRVTLERATARRGGGGGHGEERRLEAESLRLAMGLAAATLGGAELSPADRAAQATLLGPLERIVNSDPDPDLRDLASDLRIAIATYGAVCGDNLAEAARATIGRKAEESGDQTRSGEGRPSPPRGHRPAASPVTVQDMLEATYDPEVPVRAAALRTLTGLVEQRRADAVEEQDKILEVFLASVDDEDPFVYLSAIQGLATMADRHPARVFPRLLQEYGGGGRDGGDGGDGKEEAGAARPPRPPQGRVKLGEALVRATRALGDVAPAHRDRLVHAFLVGARDPDPLVRASSLCNLGELCALLSHSLGPLVHEVCSCLDATVRRDPCAEPRRAAVHAVMLLLRGLGASATEVLRDVLRDLYRLLKHAAWSDGDPATAAHARTALAQLDGVVRGGLFPEQRLEKKITVLP
ncbi:transport and Golgi organization protein 6 homolog isoform X1 [Lampetra fluviatilis]